MAHTYNTITDADPAARLIEAIETMMAAHDNWDLQESGLVISSSTISVWKNRGTGLGANSFGADFYVAFERTSTTGVRIRAFEAYTPAAGVPANARQIRPCKAGGTSPLTPNADGSWGLAAGYGLTDTSNTEYLSVAGLLTTGFEYGIILSKNYLRLALRQGASDANGEVGLLESILPGAPGPVEPMPLYTHSGQGSGLITPSWTNGGTQIATSRHPALPDQTARTQLYNLTAQSVDIVKGGPGALTEYDRWQGSGVILVGRPWWVTAGTPKSVYGYVRGRLYDFVTVESSPSSRVADEWTVNPGSPEVWWRWLYTTGAGGWAKRDVV